MQTSNLALLIALMQKNADTVEKDILRAEELLAVVRTHTDRPTQTCISLLHAAFSKINHPTVVFFLQDFENDKKEQPFQHKEVISDKLGEAEGLLQDLFLNVAKAKKSKHPQAREIESE